MALFELSALKTWVTEKEIEQARAAMDLESVHHFELDKRGRLQAGIKPAPPSDQKSSYVKITVRGKRAVVDCRQHGKGKWCLHAVILALYHLGIKPEYHLAHKKPKPVANQALGFRLEAEFGQDGGRFRLKSMSTGAWINRPFSYLKRERGLFQWSPTALDIIADVAEEQGALFKVERLDLAAVLNSMKGMTLYVPSSDESYQWPQRRFEFPKVSLQIKNQQLLWHSDTPLPENSIYAPGRPGWLISGNTLQNVSYLPDFQMFEGGSKGRLAFKPENLATLLSEKHAVRWVPEKPARIFALGNLGLRLSVDNRELLGEAGVWERDQFFPIKNWQHHQQWLQTTGSGLLLQTHPAAMHRFSKVMSAVRAPWQNGAFRIREQAALPFLEQLHISPDVVVAREEVDRWFGKTQVVLETIWEPNSLLPSYRIDGELFDHQTLMGALSLDSGLKMPDGRLLNLNVADIFSNARVIEGVQALHDDEKSQLNLLERIKGVAEKRIPQTQLSENWCELLRDYQNAGVSWLLNRMEMNEPALLADDMGLGKTIQTLALLDSIKTDKPQLIVVPRSLLANWSEECQKFCGHRQRYIHHGSNRLKNPDLLSKKELIFTTYGTVLRDIDLFYDVNFQLVVLDEAQAIKNPDAQTSQAIFELWADNRMALTGTPIENRLSELWSIFNFLAPGYLGDVEDVKNLPGPGTAAFMAFRKKVKPFLMRRLKSEVAKELPPKQELVIRVPLTQAQRAAYDQVRSGVQTDLENGKPTTMGILTKLLRLRQICCHPGLVDETQITKPSAKFEVLLEQLEEVMAGGHAALIFSQFTQLLSLLKFELEERDWSYLYLDGKTKDRQELVHQFQRGKARLFLISLKAGGTGLNLTRAGYVFHLDPWWNPMVMNQATDRAHRIGQTQTVFSYKIIASDTVEERILKLQESKKMLAEGLWEDPDSLMGNLDREALLELLSV